MQYHQGRENLAKVMKKRTISILYSVILCAWGASFAQDVPPLNPPDAAWPTPPIGGAPPPPVPGSDGVPPPGAVPPPTGTFEPFDFGGGAEDGGGFGGFGGGGGSGSSTREGKNSFQVTTPGGDRSKCSKYTNEILGDKIYDDFASCTNDLEKKVDRIRGDLDEVFDKFERQKLKTVIRGTLSRKDAEGYKFDFPKLKQSLLVAAKKGCVCAK